MWAQPCRLRARSWNLLKEVVTNGGRVDASLLFLSDVRTYGRNDVEFPSPVVVIGIPGLFIIRAPHGAASLSPLLILYHIYTPLAQYCYRLLKDIAMNHARAAFESGGEGYNASAGTEKFEKELRPAPPGGAPSPPPVAEQRRRVRSAIEETQALRVGDTWYPIASSWWQRWKRYVEYDGEDSTSGGHQALHPGRIDNTDLVHKDRKRRWCERNESVHKPAGCEEEDETREGFEKVLELRKGVLQNVDFALLPATAYKLLKEWYSGGPDLPRSVITIGRGSVAENRVSLFPYVVEVTSGDSTYDCGTARERHCGQMVVESATPASQFVQDVCQLVGIDIKFAELYSVPMVGQDVEAESTEEAEGGKEPMGPCKHPPNERVLGSFNTLDLIGCASKGNKTSHGNKLDVPSDRDGADELVRPQIPAKTSSSADSHNGAVPEMKHISKMYSKEQTVEDIFYGETAACVFVETLAWRFALKKGDALDAHDRERWFDSVVVERLETNGQGVPRVRIHFRCWEDRWDTEKEVTSRALLPLHTKSPDWRQFYVGMPVELRHHNLWFQATVTQVDEEQRKILVRRKSGEVSEVWKAFASEDVCRPGVHLPEAAPRSAPSADASPAPGSRPSSSTAPSPSASSAFGAGTGRVLGTGVAVGERASGNPSGRPGNGYVPGSGTRTESSLPGVVGLSNLGNTCFMNSMLQCLSHTGVLTDFFLSGKHEGQINEDNPLGKQGVLARTYAKLLKDMWSGRFTFIYPTEFKRVISQYAPQFAGYQQHDSQELMNFLLDGLHEDLNRVRQKPYMAVRDYAGEPDAQFAGECWARHLARNDSVVIDHCQGQYKSHLTCPRCGHESITFDPYMSLTLPLPVTSMIRVAFTFHAWPLGKHRPLYVAASLPATATANELKQWIAKNLCAAYACRDPRAASPGRSKHEILAEEEEEEDGLPYKSRLPDERKHMGEGLSMSLREEKGEEVGLGGQFPFAISLADVLDRRIVGEFKDTDRVDELARTTVTLHAFQLQHAPAAPPPPRASTNSWLSGKREASPSPPRLCGRKSPAPAPGLVRKEDFRKGEEVFVVATCVFGRARPTTTFAFASKTYERFGPLLRFTLSSLQATTRDVHARVWAATERFLREEADAEAMEEEEEKEGRREEERAAVARRLPYRLYLAKAAGDVVGEEVLDDGSPFDVQALKGRVLMAAFEASMFEKWVVKEEADRTDPHASVQRHRLDGRTGEERARKPIYLKQCLEKFSEREQLAETDPWYCPKCKDHVSAFKKMDVWSLPDVLILHLKRFSYVQGLYSGPTREKIEDLVHFPVEGLDMRDVMRGHVDEDAPPLYDLYAVSEHSGGLGGGHYTAVAKNFRDHRWYTFNDSLVSPVNEKDVESTLVTSRAYVLFYKRRRGSLKWAGARLPSS